MSQSLKYYVYIDDSVQGPYEIAYISSMNLIGSTKVCLEGSTDWASLESLNIVKSNSDFINNLSGYSHDYMPTKIGKYNIVNEIGRGGMGSVYLAIDEVLNRKVAVKELKIEDHKKRDSEAYNIMIRRFKKEAQILAQLNHKNIVSVFDIVEQNQNQYIIMEYLDGQNLEEKLTKEGELSLLESVSIIADVCLALDYIHKKNIVHRDIKPSNIVILNDGVVKLTDFGVTRDLNSATMTMDGSLVGTIAYASPEQDSRELDGRSDIFSLGVVLYELTVGQKPFTGDTIASVLLKIATKEPTKPTDINPKIHKMLENIIFKAMSKSLSQRYASAMDMYNDLITYKQALEENNFVLLSGKKSSDSIFLQNSNIIDSIPPGKIQAKDIFKHSTPPGRYTLDEQSRSVKHTEPNVRVGLNTSSGLRVTKIDLKNDIKNSTFDDHEKHSTEVEKLIEDNQYKQVNTGRLNLGTGSIENKSNTSELNKNTQVRIKANQKSDKPDINKFIFPGVMTIIAFITFFAGVFDLLDITLIIGTVWGIHYDYNKNNHIKILSYILTVTTIFVLFFSAKLILPAFENTKISTVVYYVLDISVFLISIIGSYFLIKGLDKLSLNKDKNLRPISTITKSILSALSIILIISCTDMVNITLIKNQFEKSKFVNVFASIYKDFKPGKKLNISIGKFGFKIDK